MSTKDEGALVNALSVYMDNQLVGLLHRTEPLSFTYDPGWLASAEAKPLDPSLPLSPERIDSPHVHAFFENLLPEGDQRRIVALRHQVSSVFGLLATVGGDSAGSIVLLPEGQAPQAPIYQRLTWDQVDALVHNDGKLAREREAIDAAATGMPAPRLTISGAQFKILLSLDESGQPLRPMGSTPSTHILKPDIVRTDINIFASSINETIVMRAAQLCELPTAKVSYQPSVKACLVERYDRLLRPDGTLARLWQADFCQIAGKPSDVKYEKDGGPSFKGCFDIVGASVQPGVDRRNLLRWLFFNLYVGNNDSHAKNLSLLATQDGLRLAPFYDLMSTRVYSGLGSNFAFSIGGECEPGKMGPEHLERLAKTLGIAPKYVKRIAHDTALRVSTAIPAAVQALLPSLGPTEKVMAERIERKIGSLVKRMSARLNAGQSDSQLSADEDSGESSAPR